MHNSFHSETDYWYPAAGKLSGQSLAATGGPSHSTYGHLFYVGDSNTNAQCLIDTGSEVSVIPLTTADCRHSHDSLTFTVVNNTTTHTHGHRLLTLNLVL